MNRRQILALASMAIPGFLMTKLDSAQALTFGEKFHSSLGAWVTESSNLKIGDIQIFTGSTSSGKNVEVVLTRTKKGVVALNGACTHQGCGVAAEGTKLVCPCHGSTFNANTGAVIRGPRGSSKNSIRPLAKFKVTEYKGKIYIK